MQKFFNENPKDASVAASRRDKLIEYLKSEGVYDAAFKNLINVLYEKTDYFYSPYSLSKNAAYPGGGFDHAFKVTECLVNLTDKGICRPWQRGVSPIIVGLFHGAEVICEDLVRTRNGCKIEYPRTFVVAAMEALKLTEEERACLCYSGLDETVRKFPNALLACMADVYASKKMEGHHAE